MKSGDQRHPIVNVLERLELSPRSYSGRHMNGRTCVAVVVDCNICEFFADVLGHVCQELRDDNITDDDVDSIVAQVSHMQQDNMGRDTVIYFPDVPYDVDVDDEDGDEDCDGERSGEDGA